MEELAQRTCIPCQGGVPPLSANQRQELLQDLGGDWQVIDGHHLLKSFDFNSFPEAIAWVNAHPGITAPIVGARNMEQLEPVLDAVNVSMTEELWNRVSALSYTPPPATDRNEEASEFNYGLR